jgi:TonB family protein
MTTRYTLLSLLLTAATIASLNAGTLQQKGSADPAPTADEETTTTTPSPATTRTQNPVLVSKPPLVYPTAARKAHASGAVHVTVRVGKDGRVLEAHATSGQFLLLFAAEDAIRNWRYKPALRDGQPVEATTYVTLNFGEGAH